MLTLDMRLSPTLATCRQLEWPHSFFSHFLFLWGLSLAPCSLLQCLLLTLLPSLLTQRTGLLCLPLAPHCLHWHWDQEPGCQKTDASQLATLHRLTSAGWRELLHRVTSVVSGSTQLKVLTR